MENQTMPHLFQLHAKASLRRVLESYRENLDWNEVKLITKETYTQEAFVKDAAEGRFSLYRVKEILLPEKSGRVFLAYVGVLLQDFEARLTKLVRDPSQLRDQKLKTLALCRQLALEAEVKNDITNPVKRALDFDWKVKGEDGQFYSIPYGCLDLNTFQQGFEEEFHIRHSFFNWLRKRLDAEIQEIDKLELHDPLVKWTTKDPKTKLTEILYALRSSGHFEFVGLEAQKAFETYIAKLFSLGKIDFRKIESEIRRRGGKEKVVKSKWYFLEELSLNSTNSFPLFQVVNLHRLKMVNFNRQNTVRWNRRRVVSFTGAYTYPPQHPACPHADYAGKQKKEKGRMNVEQLGCIHSFRDGHHAKQCGQRPRSSFSQCCVDD